MLWAALPRDSRCARRANPDLEWSDAEHMLHSIEYSLRVLVWMGSKDGEKNRNRPKPWGTPAEARSSRQRADNALSPIINRNNLVTTGAGYEHRPIRSHI